MRRRASGGARSGSPFRTRTAWRSAAVGGTRATQRRPSGACRTTLRPSGPPPGTPPREGSSALRWTASRSACPPRCARGACASTPGCMTSRCVCVCVCVGVGVCFCLGVGVCTSLCLYVCVCVCSRMAGRVTVFWPASGRNPPRARPRPAVLALALGGRAGARPARPARAARHRRRRARRGVCWSRVGPGAFRLNSFELKSETCPWQDEVSRLAGFDELPPDVEFRVHGTPGASPRIRPAYRYPGSGRHTATPDPAGIPLPRIQPAYPPAPRA